MVGETLRQLDSHTEIITYSTSLEWFVTFCLLQFVTDMLQFVDLLNTNRIHTNVHTKGLQNLMAKCTRSFLSSFNDQTVTNLN